MSRRWFVLRATAADVLARAPRGDEKAVSELGLLSVTERELRVLTRSRNVGGRVVREYVGGGLSVRNVAR
jgi:hypothetical protein